MSKLLLGLAFLVTSISTHAETDEHIPRGAHQLVLCAGLLTTPLFEALGRRMVPAAGEAQPDAFAIGTAQKVKRLEFAREFVGAEDIRQFLDAALVNADEIAPERGPGGRDDGNRYWTGPRVEQMVYASLIPTLMTGLVGAGAIDMITHPPGPLGFTSMAAIYGLGAYASKDFYVSFAQLLRVTFRKDLRRAMMSIDPQWSTQASIELAFIGRDVPWPDFKLIQLGWTVSEALARLMIDPPGPDADPVEIQNYQRMLKHEVAESLRTKAKDRTVRLGLMITSGKNLEPRMLMVVDISSRNLLPPSRRKPRVDAQAAPDVSGGFLPAPAR